MIAYITNLFCCQIVALFTYRFTKMTTFTFHTLSGVKASISFKLLQYLTIDSYQIQSIV